MDSNFIRVNQEEAEALGQITIQELLDSVGYVSDNPEKKTFIKPAKEAVLSKMTLTRASLLAKIEASQNKL